MDMLRGGVAQEICKHRDGSMFRGVTSKFQRKICMWVNELIQMCSKQKDGDAQYEN